MVTRDTELVQAGRDPDRLQRYFEVLAANSAGVVERKTLHDAAGIDRKTALAYEQLLKNLYLLDVLPAWTSNRLKRLTLAPKRYLVDSALVPGALRVDEATVWCERSAGMARQLTRSYRARLDLAPMRAWLDRLECASDHPVVSAYGRVGRCRVPDCRSLPTQLQSA